MTDDEGTYRYLVNRGKRPLWRRIRKSEGASWQPSILPDFDNKDKGIICTECHKRIPYKELDCVYEHRSGETFRLWICSRCDNVVKEESMDALAELFEQERSTFGAGSEAKPRWDS